MVTHWFTASHSCPFPLYPALQLQSLWERQPEWRTQKPTPTQNRWVVCYRAPSSMKPDLSWSNVDTRSIRMAASSVRVVAIVNWLTVVSIFPPSCQTLADVFIWSCLHTFSLRGAATSIESNMTACIVWAMVVNKWPTLTLQPPRRGGAQGSDSTQVIPSPW